MDFDIAFNTSYLVAFAMGVFSSVHCVGMCGSIIGTLTLSLAPEIRNSKHKLFIFVLNYNIGRLASYSFAGLILGFLGSLIDLPFTKGEGNRILQIFSASLMTGAGLYIGGWFPYFAYIEKLGSKIWELVEPFGRKFIPIKTRFHAVLFGMVWGWLPCGLVYAALTLSASTGDALISGLTMFSFGLGTLPAVIGVGIMTNTLSKLSRVQRFKQSVGILLILLALFAAFPWLNPMRVQHLG